MALRTRIRNLVALGQSGRDETEGVRMHECTGYAFGLDLRHVASDALAAGTSVLVMCMLGERRCTRSIGRAWAVTIEANLLSGLAQLGVVCGPVHIVACGAGNAPAIHYALHKIVALHSVFVRSAIREEQEVGFSERAVLKFPEILET